MFNAWMILVTSHWKRVKKNESMLNGPEAVIDRYRTVLKY